MRPEKVRPGQTWSLTRLIKGRKMNVIVCVLHVNGFTARALILYSEDPEMVAGQKDLLSTTWIVEGSLLS